MVFVTVFRHVPRPITGMIGVLYDRTFLTLEEDFDWLETTRILVERFDPSTAPGEVSTRPVVQQLLSAEGDACPAAHSREQCRGLWRGTRRARNWRVQSVADRPRCGRSAMSSGYAVPSARTSSRCRRDSLGAKLRRSAGRPRDGRLPPQASSCGGVLAPTRQLHQ